MQNDIVALHMTVLYSNKKSSDTVITMSLLFQFSFYGVRSCAEQKEYREILQPNRHVNFIFTRFKIFNVADWNFTDDVDGV